MSLKTLNIRLFLIAITSFFAMMVILVSCAQIRPLTGGEKDSEPPKEIESSPINGATNFTENSIVVKFDEYIKLNNLASQLIISPLMETPPEVIVKGKKLVIKLKSELSENTTYSLNFGNAITDITENNIFPNYKYVFSTGNFIDSLSYSGTVLNAFNLSKKESVFVLLYDQFEDSVPLKELPRYVALTDKEGAFTITNIAKGEYKLFALKDINSNYLFDLPNEAIAFSNTLISVDTASSKNTLYLFEEESDIQFVEQAENKIFGKIDIRLNQPNQNLIINPLDQHFKKQWYIEEKNETGDSITLWLLVKDAFDNLEIELKDGAEVIDTASVKIMQSDEFIDTTLTVSTNIKSSFDLNQNIIIDLARPLVNYNTDSILFYEDSVLISISDLKNIKVNQLELSYNFKENTEYELFIPPATFEDIYGLKNDTLYTKFKTKKEADYGIINLTVTPNFTENYIIQLFRKDKIVKERFLKDSSNTQYKYLAPGNYELKLIIDNNNNQKWNTGNYIEGLQPEKVIFYEKEIKIRANWDNDISWTVNE
ncbi:MAG: Ig-like domain-containing protein [Vicingaceae bacterium]